MQTRERVAWFIVCLLLIFIAVQSFVAVLALQGAKQSAQAARDGAELELAHNRERMVRAQRDQIAQKATRKKPPEQAVLIHLKLSDQKFGTKAEMTSIHALEARLAEVIKDKRLGKFDGDEFGEGECTLYMYGPDADALFAAIEALLRSSPLTKGGWATKQYGDATDPNAKEVKVPL